MTHSCPVCGYAELIHPPRDYMICPCCGTEFDNDDAYADHAELRQEWVACGASWWSPNAAPPPGWSATEQLRRAGLGDGVPQVQGRQPAFTGS